MNRSKNIFESLVQKLIGMLPQSMRLRFLRNSFYIKRNYPDNFLIKVAQTKEEFEGAFELLRKDQIKKGIIAENSPLLIDKHQILETSVVIIAKLEGSIIGTLTLVKKVWMPLPLEYAFNINQILPYNKAGGEIMGLAIDESKEDCFFPLMKFAYIMALGKMGISKVFMTCSKEEMDPLMAIMLFADTQEDFQGESNKRFHDTCLVLDIDDSIGEYREFYRGSPPSNNLYSYLLEEKESCFLYPDIQEENVFSNFTYFHYEYFLNKGHEIEELTTEEYVLVQKQFNKHLIYGPKAS